jgi:hypothetical protein
MAMAVREAMRSASALSDKGGLCCSRRTVPLDRAFALCICRLRTACLTGRARVPELAGLQSRRPACAPHGSMRARQRHGRLE